MRRTQMFGACRLGALLLVSLLPLSALANDDGNDQQWGTQQFFRRNAKWINLPSGGGSLVSGRGNFRPGFHSALRSRTLMAEPLFSAFKRSLPQMAALYGGREGPIPLE